jgi:hypothetical protein
MDMRLGDFFEFNGSMGLERRVQEVTLADGSKAQTEMLSLGGTGLTGFVGLGPYGSDTNGNGQFEAREVNPNAKGLGVRDVEFGLAIFNGRAAHEGTQWLAMTGSVGGVDLMLGLPESLKLQVYDLGLDFNAVRHEAPATEAPRVHLAGAYTTDTNGSVILGSAVFGSGSENLTVTLDFGPTGVDRLSLKDIDLNQPAALPLVRAAASGVAQVSSLIGAGSFAEGDVITLTGLTDSPLSYQVVLSDLQNQAKVAYTREQVQTGLAAKLRDLINDADDSLLVSATGLGTVIDCIGYST